MIEPLTFDDADSAPPHHLVGWLLATSVGAGVPATSA
jgi:hypothetical protein